MKIKIFILLSVITVGTFSKVCAQNGAYEMLVDGVKVIVQPSKNEIVEIQTIIKGGVQNYPANKAGIESLAMDALTECGTANHTKNDFKNQLDKVNAGIFGFTGKDISTFRMSCVKSDFDVVWPLYTEALTAPAFDAKEFARIKQDAITSVKQQEGSPDFSIDKYANTVAFAGRDYAKNPAGTPETIQPLTAEEVKAYYKGILTKSRMLIVVVADIDRDVIEKKVAAMLGGIKKGTPYELKKSFFRIYKNTFSSQPKDLATNYVEGVTSGPQPGMPDFDAFNVAMRIFADRHFLDVRSKNGLSYAPHAFFNVGTTSVAKFSVSTTDPNKYINVFDKLVDSVRTGGFNAAEVADMKVTYLTGFYYKQETNSAQASSLASNEVLFNNWKRSLTLVDDVKKLTPAEVSDAFRKYIGNTVWVYQGDTKKVNPLNFTNGTLHKADNPVSQ